MSVNRIFPRRLAYRVYLVQGHMLNAARIFASELKRAETLRDTKRLAEFCAALADLIDFLTDLTAVHPAWGEFSCS